MRLQPMGCMGYVCAVPLGGEGHCAHDIKTPLPTVLVGLPIIIIYLILLSCTSSQSPRLVAKAIVITFSSTTIPKHPFALNTSLCRQ